MLSAPVIVTPPAVQAMTVAEARLFLRVDGAALDTELALIVAAAIDDVEATTGTRLIEQTVRIRADKFEDLDHLQIGPVSAIAAMSYRDANGVRRDINPDELELTGADLERGIAPIGAWPGGDVSRISADLVVGYGETAAEVPAQLRWAVLALIRGKFEDRAVDIEPLIVNRRIFG
jgi:uncharacterized phiE125 gp8 family phage protein